MNRSRLAALSAGAMFLVASVMVPATALAAGTGTLTLTPSSVSTTTGSSFYVDVASQASVASAGASASVDFDKTKLQIVSIAKPAVGTGWNVSGITYVFPSASTISSANTSGHIPAIAAFFSDGTSSLPASGSLTLARITFLATNTTSPTTAVSLPTTGSDAGGILDGTAATYGSPVAVTATGSTVTIAAGTGTGANSTTNVTGTVDAGYTALTCPTSVAVPLARNVTNIADFTCTVGANVTWSLSVIDTNATVATHGFMRDTSVTPERALKNSAHVKWNRHLDASNNEVYDSDVNLATGSTAQAVAGGQNNNTVPLTFSQLVAPDDSAGTYNIQLIFSVASSF